MSQTIEDKMKLVLLAEKVKRYEDMSNYALSLVLTKSAMGSTLSEDERSKFSASFKGYIGEQRKSYLSVRDEIKKVEKSGRDASTEKQYLAKIGLRVNIIADQVIKIVTNKLEPKANIGKEKVFYRKILADYYRYKVEVAAEAQKSVLQAEAEKRYADAYSIAVSNLAVTDPLRLGLALNFGVFLYEIKGDRQAAIDTVQGAFEKALADLESVAEESYADTTKVMQILKDNVDLWKSEADVGGFQDL